MVNTGIRSWCISSWDLLLGFLYFFLIFGLSNMKTANSKLIIKHLKAGDFLKKENSAILLKVISVGNEFQNGYNFVELYNDVTGVTQKLIDISNYSKV